MRKFIVFVIAMIILVSAGYFFAGYLSKKNVQVDEKKQERAVVAEPEIEVAEPKSKTQETEKAQTQKKPEINIKEKIELKVPFVVQAPFGDWGNQDFQNGCEEAAMVMAMGWINGIQEISTEKSKNQIEDIVEFENKTLGYSADTDLNDMKKIFQEYFKQSVEARENIIVGDIKSELQKGNLVLAPAFGRALGNPNFTSPGPITHMLVIIGYDPATRKFITNDSGTRKGKGYQYDEDILFDAVWQYPSGKNHPDPPVGALGKGMLVVGK